MAWFTTARGHCQVRATFQGMPLKFQEPAGLEHQAPLAPLTTLELGGPAETLVRVRTEAELRRSLQWAREQGLPVTVLGGGSNVVIADRGLRGLVIRLKMTGVEVKAGVKAEVKAEVGVEIDLKKSRDQVLLTAAAGELWDALVEHTIDQGWAGLECLSGIPGFVGATPIQNVGAYGQEVADTIVSVRVLDRASGEIVNLSPDDCEFGYRSSRFRQTPDAFVVLSVCFGLTPNGAPTLRYPELRRAIGRPEPSLVQVRETVLHLRRSKSMVIDSVQASDPLDRDPNRRSAGSFFVNPIVSNAIADQVIERALDSGIVCRGDDVPRFDSGPDHAKLAAGWLIERAGFFKGMLDGNVGISSRHALALVHHGGGTTEELIRFARRVQEGVLETFGVSLRPEPVFLGFDEHPLS